MKMREIDNDKEMARIYIRNDIRGLIRGVINLNNELNNTIAALNNAAGNTPSGSDSTLVGNCKIIQRDLSDSLSTFYHCIELVNKFNTTKETSDERY